MKLVTIFNTVTAGIGFSAAIKYVIGSVATATVGGLFGILGLTCLVSFVGTLVIAGVQNRLANRKERQYFEMLNKAYEMKYNR